MGKLPFFILDVFAEKKYAGNQLAVFRCSGGVTSEEMQSIAREMNFSETTFITSDEPNNGGFDVRIFTPTEELPFAGHPTIGSAYVIRNKIIQGNSAEIVLNLRVGRIPVTFGQDGYCWMRHIPPIFGQQHKVEILAAVIGVDAVDIDRRFPIQEVSTGLPFFIVPLKNLRALIKARIEKEKYFDLIKNTMSKGILVFCPEVHESQKHDQCAGLC